MAKLSEAEIQAVLSALPGWTLADGVLTRQWEFKDFREAMDFVNHIAVLAEKAGHHPDIDIRYNKVRLSLISHDSGGLTQRDVDLAAKISDENLEI
jgi:4a-hydroxytetrahydrobiopterin dehydratase